MMRFLADENVSRLVVERLRTGGFDVVFIGEHKSGARDKEVLDTAGAEGRILITEDRDFGELVIRQRLGVRGLNLLELDRLSNSAEAEAVSEVVSAHPDKLLGNLVVTDPRAAPVRRRVAPPILGSYPPALAGGRRRRLGRVIASMGAAPPRSFPRERLHTPVIPAKAGIQSIFAKMLFLRFA